MARKTNAGLFYVSCLIEIPLGISIYALGAQVLALVLAALMLALMLAQSRYFINHVSGSA